MEKLRTAIEQARRKRGHAHDGTQASTAAPRHVRKSSEDQRDALWADITPIDVRDTVLAQNRVVTRNASEEATPFDILRTKVLLQMQQNGWTRLAITSPLPKCGKSTTSCNLALGLGRQNNLKAILFDLDLQDPSVHEVLQQKPEHTVSEVLTDQVSFHEQARRIGSNVAVSMSNRLENDPTSILLSEQAPDVLDTIQDTYRPDMMIFDLPSMLSGDNTRAFLKNVDCALIVARANKTRYNHLDVCEREIAENTNVLGVVLNACRSGAAKIEME